MVHEADHRTEWHTLRPWSLSLSVREITSVSATFTLSSFDPSTKQNLITSDRAIIPEGISINVNGAPWQRVLIRVDDATDEAVVVVYGLMPGRQYDIDLALLREGTARDEAVRRQVVTEDLPTETTEEPDPATPMPTTAPSPISSPPQLLPSSPSTTPPSSPPQPPSPSPSPSLEDRHAYLTTQLNQLTTTHSSLLNTLKSTRRESQKADGALRSEIEALKRASERNTQSEGRARQKVLALQEAVKRTAGRRLEAEEEVTKVEEALPGLSGIRDQKEEDYARLRGEADARERAAELTRKRVDALKAELGTLTHKLDRLHTKQEKLEGPGGVIKELEETLRSIEREIEARQPQYLARPSIAPIQRPSRTPAPQPRNQQPTISDQVSPTRPYALLSTPSSPSPQPSSSQTSTLSSRALPFEPTRSMSQVQGYKPGNARARAGHVKWGSGEGPRS